jgi:hypothetical protein
MNELLNKMTDKDVVLDTDASFSYVGHLSAWDERNLELEGVVIYDEKIVKVSLEEFLIECRKNGLFASRGRTLINRSHVLAISLFEDVIIP